MSHISRNWIHTTVLIRNQWNEYGTGFLVSRKIGDKAIRVFLVTNKHVLHRDATVRPTATHINCEMNKQNGSGNLEGVTIQFSLVYPGTNDRNWIEHPDGHVDILAIEVTDLLNNNPSLVVRVVGYDTFATPELIAEQDLTIGDDIMVIGYPSAFKQGDSNLPIVRQGIIASQLGKVYFDETQRDARGAIIKRAIPGFLIDGGIIPGSSGSPVVLKPIAGRLVHNTIQMGIAHPYLLGIIAETRFAPVPSPIPSIPALKSLGYAGLGMAFDASEIKKTIELFFA